MPEGDGEAGGDGCLCSLRSFVYGCVHLVRHGCLDVGCGSGALAIAIAKRNPGAQVTGIDRWGKEYASFNKPLCEENARAEGVENISFMKGDATHLEFPNETFDVVASNYVYHNIPSRDRQAILLETLRTLKKGGTFAIHDIFSAGKYGDMQSFMKKLKEMGYERVELIDTANGKWMSKGEACGWVCRAPALLTGKKISHSDARRQDCCHSM